MLVCSVFGLIKPYLVGLPQLQHPLALLFTVHQQYSSRLYVALPAIITLLVPFFCQGTPFDQLQQLQHFQSNTQSQHSRSFSETSAMPFASAINIGFTSLILDANISFWQHYRIYCTMLPTLCLSLPLQYQLPPAPRSASRTSQRLHHRSAPQWPPYHGS